MSTKARLESYRRYREANKEKRAAWKRSWDQRHIEHRRAYMTAWRSKQPPKYWYRWPSHGVPPPRKPGRTYEQVLADNRALRAKQCDAMSDSYLRGWMTRTTAGRIKPWQWPDELVELQRINLTIKRLIHHGNTKRHHRTESATAGRL